MSPFYAGRVLVAQLILVIKSKLYPFISSTM